MTFFFQLLICSRCQGAAGVRGSPGFQGYMGTRVGTCYLSVRHSVVWWPLPERRVDVRGCFNDVLALLPEIR